MLDPIALSQAGPVAILLVGIGLLAWGAVKKDPLWVPGWLYRQEQDARVASDARAEKAIAALHSTSNVVEKSVDERAGDGAARV